MNLVQTDVNWFEHVLGLWTNCPSTREVSNAKANGV